MKNSKKKSFNIISVQASILNIEVVKNYANIKVKFLSKQRENFNNKIKNLENIEDVWTFEKNMAEDNLVWKLVEVGID